MSDMFLCIYSGGRGGEFYESFKGDTSYRSLGTSGSLAREQATAYSKKGKNDKRINSPRNQHYITTAIEFGLWELAVSSVEGVATFRQTFNLPYSV
jgi:hypothetical protein